MNKKGFTVVELLAVIGILIAIMLIALPTISNMVQTNKDKYYSGLEILLKAAGKEYFKDKQLDSGEVTLEKLIDNDYIKPLYSVQRELCDNSSYVEKTISGDYIVKLKCS